MCLYVSVPMPGVGPLVVHPAACLVPGDIALLADGLRLYIDDVEPYKRRRLNVTFTLPTNERYIKTLRRTTLVATERVNPDYVLTKLGIGERIAS